VTNFRTTTPAHGSLVAVDTFAFSQINKTNVSGTSGPGAVFGTTNQISVYTTSFPGKARQPGLPARSIDGSGDRIANTVYQIGDLIFLVHGLSVDPSGNAVTSNSTSRNAARITVLRDSTNTVVTETTYFNNNFGYIYPSLAINSNGNMLIGFTRSGDESRILRESCVPPTSNRQLESPPRDDEKRTQPIVFGTPLACLWIVTRAWLIGESRSTDEWHRRGVIFQSAQQRTARHAESRGCLLFGKS